MSLLLNPYSSAGATTPLLSLVSFSRALTGSIDISSTGRASGDIAICLNVVVNAFACATPSGFTQIADQTGNSAGRVSYKILSGSETTITTGSSGTDETVYMAIFRLNRAITTVTASTWLGQTTNVNPTAQLVNPSAETVPVIVFGLTASESSSYSFSSGSFDSQLTGVFGGSASRCGYKLHNSSPASQTIDINDEGNSNILMSGYVAIS